LMDKIIFHDVSNYHEQNHSLIFKYSLFKQLGKIYWEKSIVGSKIWVLFIAQGQAPFNNCGFSNIFTYTTYFSFSM
jgi:hypothetical protein